MYDVSIFNSKATRGYDIDHVNSPLLHVDNLFVICIFYAQTTYFYFTFFLILRLMWMFLCHFLIFTAPKASVNSVNSIDEKWKSWQHQRCCRQRRGWCSACQRSFWISQVNKRNEDHGRRQERKETWNSYGVVHKWRLMFWGKSRTLSYQKIFCIKICNRVGKVV